MSAHTVVGVALLVTGLTGCAASAGWMSGVMALLGFAMLMLTACTRHHELDSGTTGDAASGYDVSCCTRNRIETCHCAPDMSCNYSAVVIDCGDGFCVGDGAWEDPGECPPDGGPDAGLDAGALPDGGGWELCCRDGRIVTCFCPGDAACGFGFEQCEVGICAAPGECPALDGGA